MKKINRDKVEVIDGEVYLKDGFNPRDVSEDFRILYFIRFYGVYRDYHDEFGGTYSPEKLLGPYLNSKRAFLDMNKERERFKKEYDHECEFMHKLYKKPIENNGRRFKQREYVLESHSLFVMPTKKRDHDMNERMMLSFFDDVISVSKDHHKYVLHSSTNYDENVRIRATFDALGREKPSGLVEMGFGDVMDSHSMVIKTLYPMNGKNKIIEKIEKKARRLGEFKKKESVRLMTLEELTFKAKQSMISQIRKEDLRKRFFPKWYKEYEKEMYDLEDLEELSFDYYLYGDPMTQ